MYFSRNNCNSFHYVIYLVKDTSKRYSYPALYGCNSMIEGFLKVRYINKQTCVYQGLCRPGVLVDRPSTEGLLYIYITRLNRSSSIVIRASLFAECGLASGRVRGLSVSTLCLGRSGVPNRYCHFPIVTTMVKW